MVNKTLEENEREEKGALCVSLEEKKLIEDYSKKKHLCLSVFVRSCVLCALENKNFTLKNIEIKKCKRNEKIAICFSSSEKKTIIKYSKKNNIPMSIIIRNIILNEVCCEK